MTPDARRRPELPEWFPPWAAELADLYFSGTTAVFVLHGNTEDLCRIGARESVRLTIREPGCGLDSVVKSLKGPEQAGAKTPPKPEADRIAGEAAEPAG